MKKFVFYVSFIVLLLLQLNANVHAQTQYVLPQVTPKSPNAAEFEKYGDIPVSLSNGTANVTIPLYTIKVGSLEIPITLSYNSSGIKTDEIPSYVGMGWNLNAGGVINYEQRGQPDYSLVAPGMFNLASGRNSLDSLKKYNRNLMTPQQANMYLQRVTEGELDGEFDSYQFSFAGNSGLFYMDTNQNIIQVPKSELRIKRVYHNDYSITDATGSVWRFGEVDYNTANPDPDMGVSLRPSFNENASIYLSGVTTAENRMVSFGYASYPFDYKTTQIAANVMASRSGDCPTNSTSTSYTFFHLTNNMLAEINFDGGRVVFELSTETRQDIKVLDNIAFVPYLKKMKVYDANGTLILEYVFTYTNGNRLRLDKIERTVGAGTTAKWNFEYIGNTYPVLMHRGKDHWGFYNGSASTGGLPAADYPTIAPGWVANMAPQSSRDADFGASSAGLLKRITYPTGGSTQFNYQSNGVTLTSPSQLNWPFLKASSFPYTSVALLDATVAPAEWGGEEEVSGTISFPTGQLLDISASRNVRPLDGVNTFVSLKISGTSTPILGSTNIPWECPAGTGGCTIIKNNIELPGSYDYTLLSHPEGYLNGGVAFLRISKRVYAASAFIPLGGARIESIIHRDSTGNTLTKRYVYNDTINQVGYFPEPYYMTRMDLSVGSQPSCPTCGTKLTITEQGVTTMSGPSVEYLEVTEYEDSDGAKGATRYTFTSNENYFEGRGPSVSPFKANWKAGKLLNKKQYRNNSGVLELLQLDSTAYGAVEITTGITKGVKAAYDKYCDLEGLGARVYTWQTPTFRTEQFNTNSQTQEYYSGGGKISTAVKYLYTSSKHTLATETHSLASNGDTLKEKTKYSFDYDTTTITGPEAVGIRLLQRKNILVPIEKLSIQKVGATEYVTNAIVYTYRSDVPAIDKVYELPLSTPMLMSSFVNSAIGSGNFTKDSRYEESARFVKYDNNLNVQQMQNSSDVSKSYLWDYNQQHPVCEASDAQQTDIAYSSFETSYHGNWSLTGGTLDSTYALTGRRCLNPGSGNLSKTNLITGKQYVLSYWSRSGTKTVTGATGSSKTGITIKGWTYYEHLLTTTATTITVTGSGLIDELRIYPAGAQMTTYTYTPLIGINAQCDARNNVSYYEYDLMRRLQHIRDADGNIIKRFEYLYYSEAGLQSVWTASGNTRCQACVQNPLYITNVQEREEKDTNIESATYGQTRWVVTGVNSSCDPAVWQNTATAVRCKRDSNFQNTGEQEQEQKDMNPCSPTYNQLRWTVIGTNTTSCPIPPACVMGSTCYAPTQKCIGGACESGVKVYTGAFNYDPSTGMYKCFYRYEFSDGTWTGNYFEWSEEMCPTE